jgi:hypothetical protein
MRACAEHKHSKQQWAGGGVQFGTCTCLYKLGSNDVMMYITFAISDRHSLSAVPDQKGQILRDISDCLIRYLNNRIQERYPNTPSRHFGYLQTTSLVSQVATQKSSR